MTGSSLPSASPPHPLHRLARGPNPWEAPDWAFATADAEARSRYDDPERIYRVLYASSSRFGCFVETLARYRVDVVLLAELQAIAGADDHVPLGEVPRSWLAPRRLGIATVTGRYADIGHSAWIARLRDRLAAACVTHAIRDLDAAALRLTVPRAFTQLVSREVYARGGYAGIRYRSKFGDEIECWAVFEPFPIAPIASVAITADDPDLARALRLHRLRLAAPDDRRDLGRIERTRSPMPDDS